MFRTKRKKPSPDGKREGYQDRGSIAQGGAQQAGMEEPATKDECSGNG